MALHDDQYWRRQLNGDDDDDDDDQKYEDDQCFEDGAVKKDKAKAVQKCFEDIADEDASKDMNKALQKAMEKEKEKFTYKDLDADTKAQFCAYTQKLIDCAGVESCCQGFDPSGDKTTEAWVEACPDLACHNGFTKGGFIGMVVGVSLGAVLLIVAVLLVLFLRSKKMACFKEDKDADGKGVEVANNPGQAA